ncbi:MAG: phosphoglycerate mutase family protein [bacterium]
MRTFTVVRSIIAALACAPLALAAQSAAAPTTVIVVRHAEKAAEPAADPPLNAAGKARADALVDLVKDAGITAIVSTQFQRTRQTAAPLAAKLGITTEIADARLPQHPRLVADSVLAKYRGKTVLVVGHSNTVAAIVAALGAPLPASVCDAEYDNAFVVTIPANGAATVTHLHYGAVSPPDASCRAMK